MQPKPGLYRANVLDNADPDSFGRIKVACPQLFGTGISKWIPGAVLPGFYNPPPIGTQVWLSFEAGDVDYPVWIGQVTGPWVASAPTITITPQTLQVSGAATGTGTATLGTDVDQALSGAAEGASTITGGTKATGEIEGETEAESTVTGTLET